MSGSGGALLRPRYRVGSHSPVALAAMTCSRAARYSSHTWVMPSPDRVRRGRRPRDYVPFGPFQFDRHPYDDALRALHTVIGSAADDTRANERCRHTVLLQMKSRGRELRHGTRHHPPATGSLCHQ